MKHDDKLPYVIPVTRRQYRKIRRREAGNQAYREVNDWLRAIILNWIGDWMVRESNRPRSETKVDYFPIFVYLFFGMIALVVLWILVATALGIPLEN